MSVQYYLNKAITLDDLRSKGYKVDRIDESYAINDNLAVIGINEEDNSIEGFEGRFFHGGLPTILSICKDFECQFITDEDMDNAIHENSDITEETYRERWNDTVEFLKKNDIEV